MNINQTNKINPFLGNAPVHAKARGPDDVDGFDKKLDADALKAKIIANRDAIIKRQKKTPEPTNEKEIAYIKEHGMQAYVEESHARKMAELREEILKALGITEESLSAMSGDQRAAIELAVNNEIKKRLAAESLVNDDPTSDKGTQLKNMMFANGSVSFAGGQSAQAQISVQEFLSENSDTRGAADFFRTQSEKSNRQ